VTAHASPPPFIAIGVELRKSAIWRIRPSISNCSSAFDGGDGYYNRLYIRLDSLANNNGGDIMDIKILGTGCAKCHRLAQTVREAVAELEIDATIENVEDITKILEYPILTTPGLVINEKVISSGRVHTKGEVIQLIKNAAEEGKGG
jgi:small redox-active disulfide protein 2